MNFKEHMNKLLLRLGCTMLFGLTETHVPNYASYLTENMAVDYLKKAANNWTQARNFEEQLQLIITQNIFNLLPK